MKVRATNEYQKRNITDKELGRVIQEGEIFDISDERFEILNGNNSFNCIFVERLEDEKKETAIPKVKKTTTRKRTTKKKDK